MSLPTLDTVRPEPASGRTDRAADRKRRFRPGPAWLILPALALAAGIFAYPLAESMWTSVSDPVLGFQNYQWFASDSANWVILGRTLWIALLSAVICLALAYPYAYFMTISSQKMKTVLIVIVLIPFWTSLMIRSFAWIILLQDTGLVNEVLSWVGLGPFSMIRNTTGILIGMVQVLLPFMVLPLYSAMGNVDLRLVQAAASLGARPSVAFFKIFVPLAMPGVISGSLLVFIQALGFYITPALLGSPSQMLISQYIYVQVNGQLQWGRGSVLGVLLLVATLLLLGLLALLTKRSKRHTGDDGDLI
ncbi:ABC transporter permease [Paeniglutamicibacter cryotolerans]|uniref:Putative spermidine/putrescine transport system permease protein n=1 Tax=Paeniglutamicibacter cryotolerans TaxID=670079 RepID=A0A839QGA8_9MICC|nr:ABC transporter permease [Paeniglutamicibacter cryotolerans]MBB2994727.1 putative spermidine/putrescine transport system permease protein [Paeniglutamicibacter cryotolerans]